jgi:bifunctional UDP-N-acetylglucosamine pyrophosphorylase/glucosamine-1-phosphate N-acetyltransferase
MTDLAIVILAAGKGTRMRSSRAKVLHEILGEPMLAYPLATAASLSPARTVVVAGHQSEEIEKRCGGRGIAVVLQEPQLGSGHAVMAAREALADFEGEVLILYGDVPLVCPEALRALLAEHEREENGITLLAVRLPDPTGYGRILRDPSDWRVLAIREERDASPDERRLDLVHSGIMVAKAPLLLKILERLRPENDQGEYYLTDAVEIAVSDGLAVGAVETVEADDLQGINTRAELARATALLRSRIAEAHMAAGVTLIDPDGVWIGPRVVIGADTVIGPGVEIRGETVIGEGCRIENGATLESAWLGRGVQVKPHCFIRESTLEDEVLIGPMAQLRPETILRRGSKVGNFVEIKKSEIGPGSKVNHLAYIGDSTVGARVNVGAGTITCNYDGAAKHRTVIGDEAFIGSNAQLVAPVTVGRGAYIASGSTITKNVPDGALAVGRGRQRNILGWAGRRSRKRGSGAKPGGSADEGDG